jgi:hypothetical protein
MPWSGAPNGPRHKLLAQDVQDRSVALILTLSGRRLVGGAACVSAR